MAAPRSPKPSVKVRVLGGTPSLYVRVTRKARDWIANPDYAGSTPVTYSNFMRD